MTGLLYTLIDPEGGAGGPLGPLFEIVSPKQLGMIGIVLVGLVVIRQLLTKEEASHLSEVRNLAGLGEFGKAGEIQFRHQSYDEAYNLFLRGKIWDRASICAERLGRTEKAAEHAEQAGNLERAAKLMLAAGRRLDAAKLYERVGRRHSAAKAAAKDPTTTADQLARYWEAAFTELLEDDRPSSNAAKRAELLRASEAAAKAYTSMGDRGRASFFERLTDPETLDAHLANPQPAGPGATAVAAAQRGATMPVEGATRAVGAPSQEVLEREQLAAAQRAGLPAVGATAADRYELSEKLGEGGMGVVYKARDKVLDRDVALKFLPETLTANDLARQMFAKEAKAAASVNHPNIITIFDFGVMQGRPFLCMEFVDGQTVRNILDRAGGNGLPIPVVLDIAEGLFAALAYAHGRSIVHRDVKPPNLMRTLDGVVKLADFGIAKLIEPGNTATKVIGTPAYMAPEQFVGRGIDHRTDIFAAGVTIYELLTGQLPYEGADRNSEPKPLHAHRPEVPEDLQQLVLSCIAVQSAMRPESATKLSRQMRKIRAKFDTTGEQAPRPQAAAAPRASPRQPAPTPAAGDTPGDADGAGSAWARRFQRRSVAQPETGYAMVKSGRKDDLDPDRQQEGMAHTVIGPDRSKS